MTKVIIDPVNNKMEQFHADLAAMKVGPREQHGLEMVNPAGRMINKSFGVASFRYNRWAGDLAEHQTLEHALEPRFWIDQAEKLMGDDKQKPKGVGDIIEVRKPDSGLYAELLVTEIGPGFVKVKPIARYEPSAAVETEDVPFVTRWNVGARKHDVYRRADKVLMKAGFQTKEAAHAWIDEHMKAMAA